MKADNDVIPSLVPDSAAVKSRQQNTWASGKPSDLPAQPYMSSDRKTIERQVDQARAAGIDGFVLNWWGPDNPTDTNLQVLLEVAKSRGFKVTVDVDLNSPFMTSAGELQAALSYLRTYLAHPAWYRFDGWPVVSFYGIRKYSVGTWGVIRQAADPNLEAAWIGEGERGRSDWRSPKVQPGNQQHRHDE